MSTQATQLKKNLTDFVNAVAAKKGRQWALETKAEMQASERYAMAFDETIEGQGDTSLGKLSGWEIGVDVWDSVDSISTFSGNKRITPHDTGNLIEAVSVMYKKHNNEQEYSVGVDYNKLNRQRTMYSWLFERHGKPGVFVKRPGKNRSGEYVRLANKNSDEMPNFLDTWNERGLANVKRIFR